MNYKKHQEVLSQIESILREEDLFGLISMGAPDDEYKHESLMLFERVNRFDSTSSIRDKLWDVFYEQFCDGVIVKIVDGKEQAEECKPCSREDAVKQIGYKDRYESAASKIKKILDP